MPYKIRSVIAIHRKIKFSEIMPVSSIFKALLNYRLKAIKRLGQEHKNCF